MCLPPTVSPQLIILISDVSVELLTLAATFAKMFAVIIALSQSCQQMVYASQQKRESTSQLHVDVRIIIALHRRSHNSGEASCIGGDGF